MRVLHPQQPGSHSACSVLTVRGMDVEAWLSSSLHAQASRSSWPRRAAPSSGAQPKSCQRSGRRSDNPSFMASRLLGSQGARTNGQRAREGGRARVARARDEHLGGRVDARAHAPGPHQLCQLALQRPGQQVQRGSLNFRSYCS